MKLINIILLITFIDKFKNKFIKISENEHLDKYENSDFFAGKMDKFCEYKNYTYFCTDIKTYHKNSFFREKNIIIDNSIF